MNSKLLLRNSFDSNVWEYYIGSNEFIEYESYDDFMSCFTEKDVTDQEASIIDKYFGEESGFCPIDSLIENIKYQ